MTDSANAPSESGPQPQPMAGAFGSLFPGSMGGSGSCIVDGMEIGCGLANDLMSMGAAEQCPDNDCGPRTIYDPNSGKNVGVLPLGRNPNTGGFMVSGTVDQYSRIGGPITDEDGNVLDNSYEWKNVGSTDVTRHLNFAGFGFGGMFFLGIVPQNSGTTVTPCSGPIPEAAGRAILIAADSAHIDPTLLSVTWRHESGFDTMPFPNPRKQNGKIVGYDVGPLQLSTNYYDRSPFTDGLTKAFTGTSFRFPNAFGPGSPNLNNFGADIRFNGDTSQNLLAGARAFAEDILPRSKGLADAAGLYRAGNRSGPYQSRFDQYTNETAADSVYLNCLRGQK